MADDVGPKAYTAVRSYEVGNKCAVVPTSWLSRKGTMCKWPSEWDPPEMARQKVQPESHRGTSSATFLFLLVSDKYNLNVIH